MPIKNYTTKSQQTGALPKYRMLLSNMALLGCSTNTSKARDCSGDSGVDIDKAVSRFSTTGSNLLPQGEPTMFGPGEYVPDPTEGIGDVQDLPTPHLVA